MDQNYTDCIKLQPHRFSNGDVYSGCWKNNLKYGRGKLFLASGSYFEGYFKEGQMMVGKYFFKNGNIYEGEFFEGKFNGKGLYLWTDGEYYNG